MNESRIRRLPWDSDFFGFEVGRLDVSTGVTLDQIREAVNASECRCLYMFVPNEWYSGACDPDSSRRMLSAMGACRYDVRTTYAKAIVPLASLDMGDVALEITSRLETLAITSGKYSRFFKDERLRPFFNDLYKEWLKKDFLNGRVFIHRFADEIDGITTVSCNEGSGTIGLVAVDAKSRGRGIATTLLQNVDTWLWSKDIKTVAVTTQGENIAARRLYEKTGFTVVSQVEVWHVWTDSWHGK